MILLGSSRDTLDIDYVGNDMQKDDFQIIIEEVAAELELEIEPVPIDRFIPLPEGNEQRKIHIGQFGNVNAYIIDPYSIALSKVDRGFETDLEYLIFLMKLHSGFASDREMACRERSGECGDGKHGDLLDTLV